MIFFLFVLIFICIVAGFFWLIFVPLFMKQREKEQNSWVGEDLGRISVGENGNQNILYEIIL